MSGASPSPSPAEQHLGDRLAALVDGELSHDARERVLAHLATCARCKAEADAQRRLKSLFVESAPPAPSAGLLARLQGLPGQPGGPGAAPGHPAPDAFRSGPGGTHHGGLPGGDPFVFAMPGAGPSRGRRGFPIHEVGRPRRRFAFVAAGAVSLAAIALGGALPVEPGIDRNARGEGGASATPSIRPGMTGGAVSVADAAVRDRLPSPGGVSVPLRLVGSSPSPLPPVSPSPSPPRISLTR
ncbi:anti-sigma factor family protein [Streptomyces sp. NPDC012888]|uniref:anti-sigma factor family protein n=1 Tax=Streptomyces sp. NPDC012888 TaxID=3364855 RepID=UPI0036A18A86